MLTSTRHQNYVASSLKLASEFAECAFAGVYSAVSKNLFDSEKLVVLGDPLGSVGSASLDLTTVRGNGQVGNGCIFRFTRSVAHDRRVSGALGHIHRSKCLREGTDLVNLHKDGVGGTGFNSPSKSLDVGDKQVVSD